MAKLTEYPQALTFDANDILIKDGMNGTKKITVEDAAKYFSQYTNTNIASAFSTQTAYTKGAYVLKDGVLYRFTENHAAGAWSTSDTTEIKLASDMSALAAMLDETNAAVVSVEGDVASILGIIAPYVSATMTAPSNITSGEYVLANGVLYRATANIASGSTLTPNGNVVAVTIGEELFEVIKSNAKKADANGTYDEMTVGQSKQLLSDDTVEDQTPYVMRTSGGALEISDREKNTIVGGTIAWNQLVNDGNFAIGTGWSAGNASLAFEDGVATVQSTTPTYCALQKTNSQKVNILSGHKVLIQVDLNVSTGKGLIIPDGTSAGGYKGYTIPESEWTNVSLIYVPGVDVNANFSIRFLAKTQGTSELIVGKVKNYCAFDLTRMFGTTIADYIYSLEQETAGAGVAWFKKLFPKDYYAYDTGSLQSVQTSAHKMVGFNAIPQPFIRGRRWGGSGYQTGVGNKYASQSKLIRVVPGATYCFTAPNITAMSAFYVYQFDADGNYVNNSGYINITVSKPYGTWTVGDKVCFVGLYIYRNSSEFTEAEIANVNWNLSLDDEKNGTYEPYVEYNYPLDSSLELRGIPELDENNKLRFNGDTYESDGTVTRKYAYAKFDGSDDEGWTDTSGSGNPRKTFRTMSLIANTAYTNILTNGITVSTSSGSTESDEITCRGTTYSSTYFYIFAPESKIADLTAFKAWLAANPVEIIYLIETTTESAEPYAEFQTVSNLGTEEYIDAGVAAGTRDVEIPVGNITEYYQDLRAKLESAPDSPDDDGDYILRRSSGENAYTRAEPILAGKANTEGDYPNLIAGGAQQLMSTVGIEDQVPYNFRTSGGTADIGDRETDMVVGGTIAWNQIAQKGLYTAMRSTVTYDSATGIATVTPTAYDDNVMGVYNVTVSDASIEGHKYLCSVELNPDNDGDFNIGFVPVFNSGTIPAGQWTRCEGIISRSSGSFCIFLRAMSSGWESGSFQYRNVQCFDLTQMFGTTIADYIYSLEQANAGDGVAWFKKLFPKEYYEEDIGTLQSVQTSAHKMVGFNAWDEEWESGTIQSANGQNAPDASRIRSKNYIPVVPNQPYYLKAPQYAIIYQYDSDKNFLGTTGSKGDNRISVFDSPTSYVRFAVGSSSNPVTTYDNDICLNLSWDGEKDGTYEPYVEYNYPLDDSLTLYGFPKLDENNRLYYDGDTYASDGTVMRKFGMVDLGTLSFAYRESVIAGQYVFAFTLPSDATAATGAASTKGIICPIYTTFYNARTDGTGYASFNMSIYRGTTRSVYIRNDDYTDAAAFKVAMSGVYVIYELATPTTETAEPYTNPQIVNDFGTEEYIDAGIEAETRDVAIPVGHQTFYQANLRAKLEMSPDSPDGDGDYIVRQANGENTYVPLVIPNELPAAPTTDGTYVLYATVADGVLTYSWVADT